MPLTTNFTDKTNKVIINNIKKEFMGVLSQYIINRNVKISPEILDFINNNLDDLISEGFKEYYNNKSLKNIDVYIVIYKHIIDKIKLFKENQ